MFEALKHYGDFKGRASRKEYWYFFLLYVLVQVACGALDAALIRGAPVLQSLAVLGLIVPGLSVGFRRLHDTDRSAWWILIGLIPFIGAVVLLVFNVQAGTPGPNRFGSAGDALAGVFE